MSFLQSDLLHSLITDFAASLAPSIETPLVDNLEFMRLSELKCLIKHISLLTDIQALQSYSKPDTVVLKGDHTETEKEYVDRQQLCSRMVHFDGLLADLSVYVESRLAAARVISPSSVPRLVQLIDRYKFNSRERLVFELMTVVQGSNDPHVLNAMIEEDYLRKVSGFQRMSGMSEVDIDVFCDSERPHMKEGIVLVDEDNGTHFNLRIQRVGVQLLYGRKVKADDILKISQTSLEDILCLEMATGQLPADVKLLPSSPSSAFSKKRNLLEDNQSGDAVDSIAASRHITEILQLLQANPHAPSSSTVALIEKLSESEKEVLYDLVGGDQTGDDDSEEEGDEEMETEEATPAGPAVPPTPIMSGRLSRLLTPVGGMPRSRLLSSLNKSPHSLPPPLPLERCSSSRAAPPPTDLAVQVDKDPSVLGSSTFVTEDDGNTSTKPYPSEGQLEYLEDSFQLIALMVKSNAARMKDDMKKEGTTSSFGRSWAGDTGEMKSSKRELAAKLKLHESRVSTRLSKTVESGHPLPRLESLMQRFQLDKFEKKVITLLIGKTVSPLIKTLMETLDTTAGSRLHEDSLTIGQTLAILCDDFRQQISHRKYFYQSSKLLKNAVISLSRSRWHVGTGDLTENKIVLDRRILDWVVGLDSEINELVEGSDLYEPTVSLSHVVLPTGYIDSILSQTLAYGEFQKYRVAAGLEKTLSYGNSLVILLYGKSGTGKTLTVNAIAKELKKKVLLVDFSSLMSKKESSGSDMEVDLKGLFRESMMSNAVLFFDECEQLFLSRNQSSNRILNSLLTEIERHEGIVFLATNRPHEIDEAMHRRITMVLEYREPDEAMRKRIWDSLLLSHSADPTEGLEETLRSSGSEASHSSATPLEGAVTENEEQLSKKARLLSTQERSEVMTGEGEVAGVSNGSALLPLSLVPSEQSSCTKRGITLSADVDTSILAMKYALTGGFIKNAVLSAILSALSREKAQPIVNMQDLTLGCQLQLRGALTQRNFNSERITPDQGGLARLHLSESHRLMAEKIVRHEHARATVYGSWNIASSERGAATADSVSATGSSMGVAALFQKSATSSFASSCQQKASINLLAGPLGSGKTSLVKAVSFELGERHIKYMHTADFLDKGVSEVTAIFKTLVSDCALMDSMILIDGFEHIFEDSGGDSGNSTKMHLLLSRVMDILYTFHGTVFLLCHMDKPQNISLQRDFASRLMTFLRFETPSHDLRTKLWRSIMPAQAPLSSDINFEVLGRKFEMNAGLIRSSIANAAAEVAMRGDRVLYQKDLLLAGEQEIAKGRSGNFELISKLFV